MKYNHLPNKNLSRRKTVYALEIITVKNSQISVSSSTGKKIIAKADMRCISRMKKLLHGIFNKALAANTSKIIFSFQKNFPADIKTQK